MGFKVIHKGDIPDEDPNWFSGHVKCCWNCDSCDNSLDKLREVNDDIDNATDGYCNLFNDVIRWDWYCDNYKEISKIDNEFYKVEYVDED